jgi:hypothetical protein
VESLGGSENATKQEHFQAKWNHLAARKMRPNRSIFKPSGITWRLGKCDQTGAFSSQVESLGGSENATKQEHFQAKWNHLAARKMRPNICLVVRRGSFGSGKISRKRTTRPLFCPPLGWYGEANPGAFPRRFGRFVARAGYHWRFAARDPSWGCLDRHNRIGASER